MASIPLVAIEAPTSTTGSDGLAVFTFAADIDAANHELVVGGPGGGLREANGINYTVTGTRQITFISPYRPVAGEAIWLFNGASGVTIATSLPSWDTVANLISDAAIELGIAPNAAPIANPFASTDPNILQLLAYLKSGGRDLAKRRDWTHLQKEYTFVTANGINAYGLPGDYRSLIPNSGWNRSTQYPLGGPVGAEYWQFRKATVSAGTVYYYMRFWQGQIFFDPTPTSVQTLAFEYQSTSWIKPSGATAPSSSAPLAASDVVCFEPNLVVARLRLEFRKNKGFDTAAEQDSYDDALYAAESEDSPASTIYLGGRSKMTPRRLNRWNLPDTGVGQ